MDTKRFHGQTGYVLVAAMLIMLLITSLGVLAMVTSTSEQVITTNIGEKEMMFFFAEQAVDRIINHLHYLKGGLFATSAGGNGLAYDPTQGSNDLPPRQIMNDIRAIYLYGEGASASLSRHPLAEIDAYLDPENFAGTYDRGLSRSVAISALVKQREAARRSPVQKAFRIYARPRAVWDFAYFSLNHNPKDRLTAASASGENCIETNDPNNWYACQSVFLDGDTVMGDTYISNVAYTTSFNFRVPKPDDEPYPDSDRARLFVRGRPLFSGEVRWRSPLPFGDDNQTKGGSAYNGSPEIGVVMKANSKPIMPPPMDQLIQGSQSYKSVADIILANPGTGDPAASTYAWRIIFRNDLDTTSDGVYAASRVASAITESINRGASPTLGDVNFPTNEDCGVMLVYRIPFHNANSLIDEENKRAAFYGDTMAKRHAAMSSRTIGVILAEKSNAIDRDYISGGGECFEERDNLLSSSTYGPYDPNDIQGSYDFMPVPSRGLTKPSFCTGSGYTYNGVIFVEGDVIVSGILDGQVTIVATGNIWLDHEVEYENHPTDILMTDYADPREPDMLGLFATGNVIIPNSYPEDDRIGFIDPDVLRNHPWRDDWSDPHNPNMELTYPTAGGQDTIIVGDDTGDEDIHAVILSYAHQPCSSSGGTYTCTAPQATDIRLFRTGLYATPRTLYLTFRTDARPGDQAYDGASFDLEGGNDSGQLTIIGAVIQNIPGRLAYDYISSTHSVLNSSCTGGSGNACHRIGFSKVSYLHDPRLKYMMPPYPRQASSNNVTPYGHAVWDIISWEEIDSSTDISASVW